jgi:hypothetical protein
MLPVRRDIKPFYASSLVIAIVTVITSITGILSWSHIYPTAYVANTVGSDTFNLIIILPVLLAAVWLAHRGHLIGLLLWPGALFYLLYIYTFYVIQLSASVLFLLHVVLIVLSTYTIIGLAASIDARAVRQQLSGAVPARAAGAVLIGLALLFIALDLAALTAAIGGNIPVDTTSHAAWTTDLVLECPALLFGGILLWLRKATGYAAGAGLLFQIGALIVGVPAGAVAGAMLTGSVADTSSAVLLIIGVIPIVLVVPFVRATAKAPAEA